MAKDRRRQLSEIKQFKQLIAFLRDEMGWPIDAESDFDDLTYEYTTAELGIDETSAAQIQDIKRLRPLSPNQPWGVFFVKFEPKKLPVIALRRILSQVALKKRASANPADRSVWAQEDLLFISNYGEGDDRQITLAHFSAPSEGHTLPTLKVLGWDSKDTVLHLDAVARELTEQLSWPSDESDVAAWRAQWSAAFTVGHQEVITTSKALSIRLAQLARDIRDRISAALAIETKDGPLTKLMKAFQESLIHDLTPEDFADMYAQTITYGLLSSRIVDPKNKSVDGLTAHMRLSPFLKELMATFLAVNGRKAGTRIDFDELGVGDVVELLDRSNMEAVVADFGDKNAREDPVMHFFEGFLEAYNKEIKRSRGVFYTPQPVVSYIVRSVHELLQTEFSLADGLADTTTWGEMLIKRPGLKLPPLTDELGEKLTISPDEPFVQILDPATGTATFLVEVIEVIHSTLKGKWNQQRLTDAQQLDAWNEYVPQHLLPRLHAYELMMAPYAIAHMKIGLKLAETGYRFDTEQRARIYLTNALEPWVKQLPLMGFDALAHEAAAVNEIKRQKRFTVVMGNPPYSGRSQNTGFWITQLVSDYYFVDGNPLGERNPSWLLDDYVKFIRLGEELITTALTGIVGFITNHGFVDNPTFRGMRDHLLHSFSILRILDLHGNAKKLGKDTRAIVDENVFDIQQGVAIFVAAKLNGSNSVLHTNLRGSRASKYATLLSDPLDHERWIPVIPSTPFYLFYPQDTDLRFEYEAAMPINEVFPLNGWGVSTRKDYLLVDFDRNVLISRFRDITSLPTKTAKEKYSIRESPHWSLEEALPRLPGNVDGSGIPMLFRPFDTRFVYYERAMIERGDHRYSLMKHMIHPNRCLISIRRLEVGGSFEHVFCGSSIADAHSVSMKEHNFVFPLYIYPDQSEDGGQGLFLADTERRPNISERFMSALMLNMSKYASEPSARAVSPEDVFHYAYAVFHSPSYRSRYAEFLKIDFPRLPLTENLELFRALARLGGELTALHLLESPKLDQPITEFVGSRNPEVEKASWSCDTVWMDKAQTTGFSGVSESVWNFHIGGYQVCEKWLKDRKGRTLSDEDIAHYQKIVVALSETIRLMKEIDEVIEHHGGWPGAFAGEKAAN